MSTRGGHGSPLEDSERGARTNIVLCERVTAMARPIARLAAHTHEARLGDPKKKMIMETAHETAVRGLRDGHAMWVTLKSGHMLEPVISVFVSCR